MIFYRKYCELPLRLKRFIIDQGLVFHFRLGQIYRKIQDSKGKIESWWDTRSEEASLPCALAANCVRLVTWQRGNGMAKVRFQ